MHVYEACPSQEHNAMLVPMQHSNDQEAPPKMTDDSDTASTRSSLDLDVDRLDDNAFATRPNVKSALLSNNAPVPVAPRVSTESFSTTSQTLAPTNQGYNEMPAQPLPGSISTGQASSWRLQTTVIGFFLLALIHAVGHCGFFFYLDGRVLSSDPELSTKRTTIPQGHVTTISFLFITAFRASLVASIGACYTQYLWATLREHVFKVGFVEDLFQIQTNAFHLKRPHLYLKTPVLAAIAIFSWLVPLATVYPSSALIVELETLAVNTRFNVSMLHVNNPFENINYTAHIWCQLSESSSGPINTDHNISRLSDPSFLRGCESRISNISSMYDGWFPYTRNDAPRIAVSTWMSGEITKMDPPAEANVSYTLEFWGTTLRCHTENRTLERIVRESDVVLNYGSLKEGSSWEVADFIQSAGVSLTMDKDLLLDQTTFTNRLSHNTNLHRYYPCLETNPLDGNRTIGSVRLPEDGITFLSPITETVCRPEISRYSVTIAHQSGYQNISRIIRSDESIPSYHRYFKNFNGSFEQWVQFSDALTVYAEFAYNLNRTTYVQRYDGWSYKGPLKEAERQTLTNGTSVETCELYSESLRNEKPVSLGPKLWPLSVFAQRIKTPEEPGDWDTPFDADMANELLINSTINMLSLNRHFGMVNGTTSRIFNVYRFRNKLAFFLPYGLALGLSIPIIALGLAAFYTRNQRVSAITGGFLQILMTTTGCGLLQDVVVNSSSTMGGHENISEELRETKIMFGEVIQANRADDGRLKVQKPDLGRHGECTKGPETFSRQNDHADARAGLASGIVVAEKEKTATIRAGFGTAEEVRPFRKRMVHK